MAGQELLLGQVWDPGEEKRLRQRTALLTRARGAGTHGGSLW